MMAISHPFIPWTLQTAPDGGYLQVAQQIPSPSLTPPTTPTVEVNTVSNEVCGQSSTSLGLLSETPCQKGNGLKDSIAVPLQPREFLYRLNMQKDEEGYPVEYGRGVWSTVYMATSCCASQAATLSPPPSPAAKTRILAVKSPLRRDARAVLEAEALVLTQVDATPGKERYVVPFLGYIPASSSIVMSAVPLALSTYIEARAGIARQNFSTRTMFDPALGMAEWCDLAKQLVAGLSWLHSKSKIIHGDIKPHNILLRPRHEGVGGDMGALPYEPLYADFSSSHSLFFHGSRASLSALTPPFAAPELLSLSALKSPSMIATEASDVFSLAVTLLAAATGDLLLYPATSSMQRLAMSRDGHRVLEFVRAGAHGSRVPRRGVIEVLLQPAIAKEPSKRIGPEEWLKLVESDSG